jgi:hypothetical protein
MEVVSLLERLGQHYLKTISMGQWHLEQVGREQVETMPLVLLVVVVVVVVQQ